MIVSFFFLTSLSFPLPSFIWFVDPACQLPGNFLFYIYIYRTMFYLDSNIQYQLIGRSRFSVHSYPSVHLREKRQYHWVFNEVFFVDDKPFSDRIFRLSVATLNKQRLKALTDTRVHTKKRAQRLGIRFHCNAISPCLPTLEHSVYYQSSPIGNGHALQ